MRLVCAGGAGGGLRGCISLHDIPSWFFKLEGPQAPDRWGGPNSFLAADGMPCHAPRSLHILNPHPPLARSLQGIFTGFVEQTGKSSARYLRSLASNASMRR